MTESGSQTLSLMYAIKGVTPCMCPPTGSLALFVASNVARGGGTTKFFRGGLPYNGGIQFEICRALPRSSA